jgi:hypothetical protein
MMREAETEGDIDVPFRSSRLCSQNLQKAHLVYEMLREIRGEQMVEIIWKKYYG